MSHHLKGTLDRRRRVMAPSPFPDPETPPHPFLSALAFLNSCTCRPQLDLPLPPPMRPQPGTDSPGSICWDSDMMTRGRPQSNTCPVHGAQSLLRKNPLRTPPRRRRAHQPEHDDSEVETDPFSDTSNGASAPTIQHDRTSICSTTFLLLVLLCCALLFKLPQE